MVWLGWLYSQEWWRREMWKAAPPGTTLEQEMESRRRTFFANNDANDLILQARTWQRHDVGTTPGFNGDVERALGSIAVPVLYMPSETDLYFPIGDARYEASFIPRVTLTPIPSLWGHPAGAGGNPADRKFLNDDDRAVSRRTLAGGQPALRSAARDLAPSPRPQTASARTAAFTYIPAGSASLAMRRRVSSAPERLMSTWGGAFTIVAVISAASAAPLR